MTVLVLMTGAIRMDMSVYLKCVTAQRKMLEGYDTHIMVVTWQSTNNIRYSPSNLLMTMCTAIDSLAVLPTIDITNAGRVYGDNRVPYFLHIMKKIARSNLVSLLDFEYVAICRGDALVEFPNIARYFQMDVISILPKIYHLPSWLNWEPETYTICDRDTFTLLRGIDIEDIARKSFNVEEAYRITLDGFCKRISRIENVETVEIHGLKVPVFVKNSVCLGVRLY